MQQHPDWIMWEAGLSDEACDEILKTCYELPSQNATTFRQGEDPIYEDPNRKTQIRWLEPGGDSNWINDIMSNYAEIANEYFNVELDHLPALQFTEYKDIGYHYGWHHDIDWANQTGTHRKISFVLQLSDTDDYSGGDFQFRHCENPDAEKVRARGTVIAFLSYQEHCVTPILNGARVSLVGWYRGPRWR